MLKKLKIPIIIALSLASIFVIISAVWLIRYFVILKPMTDNTKLKNTGNGDYYYGSLSEGYDDTVSYSVWIPSFLKFAGNLCVSEPMILGEEAESCCCFLYTPRFMDESEYYFCISVVKEHTKTETEDSTGYAEYYVQTDKDLNLINEDKTGLYDEYYDKMVMLYDKAKAFFGEDVFR